MGQSLMGQPASHVVEIEVLATDIDAYQHVNNSVYLSWLDRAAWSHSAQLGVPLERCLSMRRGMAAHRSEIDYLRRSGVRGNMDRLHGPQASCGTQVRSAARTPG